MKNPLSTIAALLSGAIIIFSCDPRSIDPIEIPKEEEEITPIDPEVISDTVEVKIGANLDFLETPLTKAVSPNDLYSIRLYSVGEREDDVIQYSYSLIAFGYFDDLSPVVLKLSKKSRYAMDMVYIPNGKRLINHTEDNFYGDPREGFDPFSTIYYDKKGLALNELEYINATSEYAGVAGMNLSIVKLSIIDGYDFYGNGGTIPFYSGTTFFDPNETDVISVNLHTRRIHYRINISDIETGSISITNGWNGRYTFYPEGGECHIDFAIDRNIYPNCTMLLNKAEGVSIEDAFKERFDWSVQWNQETITIVYTEEDGDEIILYKKPGSFRPGYRYNLSFSLSEAIANSGIVVNVDDDDIVDEDFPF